MKQSKIKLDDYEGEVNRKKLIEKKTKRKERTSIPKKVKQSRFELN